MRGGRASLLLLPTLLLVASGCGAGGGDGAGCGFALSLASDTGGQPTPVAAATWFATHGGVAGLPRDGWRVADRSGDGATLISVGGRVHAVRGADRSWQVDSGTTCR